LDVAADLKTIAGYGEARNVRRSPSHCYQK
jgi:hypothetical protein